MNVKSSENLPYRYKGIVYHWKLRRVVYEQWPYPAIQAWSNIKNGWIHLFFEK